MEGLRGLLLAFEAADKQLFTIGAAKTMLADPEFPAWALFTIRADNLAADKMGFFPTRMIGLEDSSGSEANSGAGSGAGFFGCSATPVSSCLGSCLGNQCQKPAQHTIGEAPNGFPTVEQSWDFN